MNRDFLAEDSGMLFFLGRELNAQSGGGFHMRNVNFPLDLIFISAEKEVVDIQTVPPCQTEICPVYRPISPAHYVLELNAHQSQKCNLSIGDLLDF